MRFPTLSIQGVEGWMFGIALRFEYCGCKSLALGCGPLALVINFGNCINAPKTLP